MLNLVIEDDEGRRTAVPLSRSDITIGRNDDNLIRLSDRNVSRLHARILKDGERVYIEDRSRYGSRKNGRKFTGRTTLQAGDIVLIGDYRLQLVDQDAALAEASTGDITEDDVSQALDAARSGGPPPMPGNRADAASTSLPPERQSRLRCTTDPFTGAEFVILDTSILVGSGEDCDVVIEHESIARRHARIITEGSKVRIENVDPVAALIVNGVVETRVDLKGGETIGLGRLQFQFVAAGAAAAAAAKPAARPAPLYVEESEPEPAGRPAWLVPALATGAVVAVAALVFLVIPALRGPGETVVDISSADTSGSALATAQQHFNAARWADSIAAADQVAADHPQAAAAADLRQRAEAELQQSVVYDQVRTHIENGEFGQAQATLDAIPRSSYYRSRAADDGTERRILNGLIETAIVESQDQQAAGDTAAARNTITAAQLLAPDDARLRTRLEQIDNPQANNRPVPEVAPPSQPVAAATPPPVAVQTNTAREPAPTARPEPVRPAPERAPATPEPVRPSTAAAPTPAPTPVPAAAAPRPATVDEAPTPADAMSDSERAADLLNRARRLAINQEYADSIRLLDEAQALQPNNAQIQLLLHNNYRRIGNNLRAANAARRYLDLVPGAPQRDELEAWLSANAP